MSSRSYAFGLLRWYRHLELSGVTWERADRGTVRDFVLACKQPSALCARALSPRTINHNLAVVSSFYAFHIGQQRGPLLNPVPQRGQGRGGRFAAHHNPEHPFTNDRRADLRQRVPVTAPRSLTEQRIAGLFRVLNHPRDRALLAFYLSSAARPSELLNMGVDDLDPGRQQLVVVRKGTSARQVVPASSGSFLWMRLYQDTLPPELLQSGQPAWWTRRRPFRPLNYDAARAMLRRAGEALGAHIRLHDLRHTAAAQMAQDSSLSLPDIQRILGHANLSTTEIYVRQHDADVLTRVAEHLRAREQPQLPPSKESLRYDHDDLIELMGDDPW
ncbi:tyrosine-type recombinase/integrase [Agromyces sp. NPDC058484]|uniref:tyrosine-type recombinase/integrase n=1 Tax=Agromyces sp. NPDC058484 TaxID=3346524 RepID=UPI00364B9A6D